MGRQRAGTTERRNRRAAGWARRRARVTSPLASQAWPATAEVTGASAYTMLSTSPASWPVGAELAGASRVAAVTTSAGVSVLTGTPSRSSRSSTSSHAPSARAVGSARRCRASRRRRRGRPTLETS